MDKKTILITEDHPSLREAVQRILEGAGYTALPTANGVEALQAMEDTVPDLILADIMMPEMDGYAFYRAVRARPEGVTIPFIFLTSKAGRDDRLKGKALGAEDYLAKPFDPEELLIAVSARLERAHAIREAAEAEIDQIKQQIVTVLGHELRTPLTYIQGYSDLALEDVPSLSPGPLQEFLYGINRGAERLTRLVNDFLRLIHLDTGQAATEFHQVARIRHDLDEIVTRTAHQLEERAEAKGVTLETNVQHDLPPVLLCESFFVDALGRLIDNAIKFSLDEGKRVTVTVQASEGWVAIATTDEGIGIPAAEIPHLFERFRQIDRERLEQQGTGMGLAITRGLIHLHGGEIDVGSAPGFGSTFTIKLPLAEA